MLTCPRGCKKPFVDELELYRHLREAHRMSEVDARRYSTSTGSGSTLPGGGILGSGIAGTPGWYERPQETPAGKKALEHQIAAEKAKMESQAPLRVPMVPMQETPQVKIADGWRKTNTGYNFERLVHEAHTIENIIQQIVRGNIIGNHGELVLWSYDKDISQLSEDQNKAGILEARLVAYVPSDPEFVTVANELHDLKFRISKSKKEIKPETYSELLLEDEFHEETTTAGNGEYEKWVGDFMERCGTETESTIKLLNKPDPIKLK